MHGAYILELPTTITDMLAAVMLKDEKIGSKVFTLSPKLGNQKDRKRSFIRRDKVLISSLKETTAPQLMHCALQAFDYTIDFVQKTGRVDDDSVKHKLSESGLLATQPGAEVQDIHGDSCPVADRMATTLTQRARPPLDCDISMILTMDKPASIFFATGSHNYLCGISDEPGEFVELEIPIYSVLLFDSTLIHCGKGNTGEEYNIRAFAKYTITSALCQRTDATVCAPAKDSIYHKIFSESQNT